ncbi:Integrin beta-PS [Amphibalanus amphitrite]|uniref:Integrin beta n=1 Tax=Amphibalanus amphitrite TaxID=1232801 RepID=A0A6A4VUB2_AMPAM|nr:Integrin beta-PS [Amphibalanus amphitrite]
MDTAALTMWRLWAVCAALAVTAVWAQEAEKLTQPNPCTSKQTCSECMQTPTCAWCALPTFEATQIAPQRVRMSLRVHEAHDLKVQFALAPNYPIDLYYLMDLSKSMEDDKDKLSTLGNLLAQEMRKLTSNFRLGFGSFVDKVVMPYVSTVPANLESPCTGCEAPYGYQNALSLTSDTEMFAREVRDAKVSGNLDAPEGGFDAIMQAIVCKEEISWRSNARRLLVFSTDAGFHYAGDGKLGGVVKPNDGVCHLDSRGRYTHSDMLDYPSVSQINQKVKENSINVIFAVTAEQRETYDELSRHIEASSAGTLSNDSSNVVTLVKQQYDAITSFVEMKDNSTEFVRIRYYSACRGNTTTETNRCDKLKIGQQVNFTAKVELIKCPEDPARWNDIIEIKPAGLNESLIIDLAMQCQCDCDRPGGPGFKPAAIAAECNYGGDLQCGKCVCDPLHFGAFCECSQSDPNGRIGEDQCRPPNSTDILCYGRGECVCGECNCYPRENPNEEVKGDFCECDNFSCDRHEKLLCSGPDHGSCVCGECSCLDGWTGNACQCPASNASCIAPGDTRQCSGAGECVCGQCVCKEEQGARYSGKYCEDCPTCRGKCELYKPCVNCVVHDSGELKEEGRCEEECSHLIINKTDVVEVENPDERICTFSDEHGCRYQFVYGYDGETQVIRAQETKKCPPAINILGIVLTLIAAIVVVGMAVLMLWKLLTTIHDRREYAKWDSERKMAKWDTGENPIYKQATSTYKNPAYGGK